MDAGFGMVARHFVETEALHEDVRKLADGVTASNQQLAKHPTSVPYRS